MKRIENIKFFKRDTITVAKDLIGKWIITNIDGVEKRAQISETEAYLGVEDSACHTYKGKRTDRTEPMWCDGGTIYIYLCYGLHYLLNIVTRGEGEPEAVLIRAVVGGNGPAKATKILNINKFLNGAKIVDNPNICIVDDGEKYNCYETTRVGIEYALDKDRNAKLRFVLDKKNKM